MRRINLDEKFGLFTDHWRPKIIAAADGQEVKIVKVQGEFPWHRHDTEDVFFMVWKGRFRVEFSDHVVELGPGNVWSCRGASSTAPAPIKRRRSC
jgi:mannose-6-phosphate isomerase-like protein (cupin superfamily)